MLWSPDIAKLKNYSIFQRYRKRKKGQDLLEILHEVEKFKSSPNHDITGVHKKMKPLFTKLLEHYETIHDYNEAKVCLHHGLDPVVQSIVSLTTL